MDRLRGKRNTHKQTVVVDYFTWSNKIVVNLKENAYKPEAKVT